MHTGRVIPEHAQSQYTVRCEWGLDGARAVAADTDVIVVVDVLSFTSCVCVAVEKGIEVYPYPHYDDSAVQFARAHHATLAVRRSLADAGDVTLSPSSIRAVSGLSRLVLPSPNGSTIVHEMSRASSTVIAASLHNAAAVAAWIAEWIAERPDATVAVIPAGERWPHGGLRPAIEDLWGAGAVVDGLPPELSTSPEAEVARDAWRAVSTGPNLRDCSSGRELIAIGFGEDVDIAAEIGTSDRVPIVRGGRFQSAPDTPL